jgi:hypothetical protein
VSERDERIEEDTMAASDQEEIGETQGTDASDLTDALSGGDETTFITGEEKKPVNRTSMLLFGVLMIGAAGYYFMHARTGPATAVAATAEAEEADKTINQFLSAGDENIRVMRQLRQTTDKVVAQFRNSEVPQVPVNDLQANPFKYAQVSDDATAAAEAAKKKEEGRQAALKGVQQLQLQSILHGAKPTCMINNQMYTEGQSAEGFTVEKITPNSIVVRSGAYRFELKMKR